LPSADGRPPGRANAVAVMINQKPNARHFVILENVPTLFGHRIVAQAQSRGCGLESSWQLLFVLRMTIHHPTRMTLQHQRGKSSLVIESIDDRYCRRAA
jgi:hypothetical protein